MSETENQTSQDFERFLEYDPSPFLGDSQIVLYCGVPGCDKRYCANPKYAIKYLMQHYVGSHPGLVFVDWDGSGRNVRNHRGVKVQTTLVED